MDSGWQVAGSRKARRHQATPATPASCINEPPTAAPRSQPYDTRLPSSDQIQGVAQLPGWETPAIGQRSARRGKGRQAAARTPEERAQAYIGMIQEQQAEVEASPFAQNLSAAMRHAVGLLGTAEALPTEGDIPSGALQHWDDIEELVIYGLGSVEDSRVSRYSKRLWF